MNNIRPHRGPHIRPVNPAREFFDLEGKLIRLPHNRNDRPDKAGVDWHMSETLLRL